MKYEVTVGYTNFVFDDPEEAMDFAFAAKRHIVEEDGRYKQVEIRLVNEDDKEEEED